MTKTSVAAIMRGLNSAGVRYLVIGGLAVNAHGYLRLTVDVDLIIELESKNILLAMRALKDLGYVPKVPVPMEDFADEEKRRSWHEEKGAQVFALRSDAHPETDIDLFITDPLGFSAAHARCDVLKIENDLAATVCAYEDLVKLKMTAGRPKDLLDLEQLRKARGES